MKPQSLSKVAQFFQNLRHIEEAATTDPPPPMIERPIVSPPAPRQAVDAAMARALSQWLTQHWQAADQSDHKEDDHTHG